MNILSSNGFIKVERFYDYHIEVTLWGSRKRLSTKYNYIV